MICPKCNVKTMVVDSRYFEDDDITIRKHRCPSCLDYIFTKENQISLEDGYEYTRRFMHKYREGRKG